jgi:hypothetical protein
MHDNEDEVLTPHGACRFIGGTEKPISVATLYRGVKAGRFSPPEHPSPGISRFRKSKLREDLRRLGGKT